MNYTFCHFDAFVKVLFDILVSGFFQFFLRRKSRINVLTFSLEALAVSVDLGAVKGVNWFGIWSPIDALLGPFICCGMMIRVVPIS